MKKELELKIGDIVVITSASNVYTIGLFLGYKTLMEKVFYKLDVILSSCFSDKIYCANRISLVLDRARSVLNENISIGLIFKISNDNKCNKIIDVNGETVKSWYMKNRLIDTGLPILVEKKDIVHTSETLSKDNLNVGSVLKTPISDIYYVYTGVDNMFVKLNKTDFEFMMDAIYLPDHRHIVDKSFINRLVLLPDVIVDESRLKYVLEYLHR